MSFPKSCSAVLLIALSSLPAGDTAIAQQQQSQTQKPAGTDRNEGLFRGSIIRRLRDEIKREQEQREREQEREKIAREGNRNQQPTPARRPPDGPGLAGGNPTAIPNPYARQTTPPGYHLSDAPGAAPQTWTYPDGAPPAGAPRGNPPGHPEDKPAGFGFVLENSSDHVVVQSVAPGGNADQAGLKPGDVLIRLGGIEVASIAEFDEITGIMNAGDQIDFVGLRRGREFKGQLQFGALPESGREGASVLDAGPENGAAPPEFNTDGPPLDGPSLGPPTPYSLTAPSDFVPPRSSLTQPRQPLATERQVPAPRNPQGNNAGYPAASETGRNLSPAADPAIVAQLQQTILQQQQTIRQLQREVEELRKRLPSQQGRRRN